MDYSPSSKYGTNVLHSFPKIIAKDCMTTQNICPGPSLIVCISIHQTVMYTSNMYPITIIHIPSSIMCCMRT